MSRPQKKSILVGKITHGLLQGCRATVIRKRDSGYTVSLLDARGAYQVGDTVCLSAGEFQMTEGVQRAHATIEPHEV